MSNRLPVEVNPFRLIEQRRLLTGSVSLKTLPRLREQVLGAADDFAVTLDFTHSASQLPMITCQVKGEVELECQRCLEPVKWILDTQSEVVLTTSDTDRQPEEDGYEVYIVEDEHLPVLEFVEDEILLALPAVPRHDDCTPVKPLRESEEVVTHSGQQDKQNPFAVLKDWKKLE